MAVDDPNAPTPSQPSDSLPGTPPAGGGQEPAADNRHPDVIAYERLEAEAAAEAAGQSTLPGEPGADTAGGGSDTVAPAGSDTVQPAPGADTAPGAGTGAAPAGAPPVDEEVRIPKKRFDEVLARARNAEETNAYLQGQIDEARRREAATTAPAGAAPEPSPEEKRHAAIDAELEDAAKKYEDGTIGFVEFQKTQRALTKEQLALEQTIEAARSQPDPEVYRQEIKSNPIVVAATAEMLKTDAWILGVPKKVVNESLTPLAYQDLERQGVRITPDAAGTIRLRSAIIAVGRSLGLHNVYKAPEPPAQTGQPPAGTPPAGNGAAKPNGNGSAGAAPTGTPAVNQPPNLAVVGQGGGGNDPTDTKRLEEMSSFDLGLLPKSVLDKIAPTA